MVTAGEHSGRGERGVHAVVLGGSMAGLPPREARRAAKLVDTPWMLAVGEDFRYPEVAGPKARGTDLLNWYVAGVHRAAIGALAPSAR